MATEAQMKASSDKSDELRLAQLNDEVKMIKANKNSDFEIAEHDEMVAHVRILNEIPIPGTKKFDPVYKIVKVSQDQWKRYKLGTTKMFVGVDGMEVLHDPDLITKKKAEPKQEPIKIDIIPPVMPKEPAPAEPITDPAPKGDELEVIEKYKLLFKTDEIPEGTSIDELREEIAAMEPKPKNKK